LHGVGRVLLGGGPELIANGSPCPVLVAPPGFRDQTALSPETVGVAYDGTATSEAALRYAAQLSDALSLPLSVIGVHATGASHPIGRTPDFEALLNSAIEIVTEMTGGRVTA